MSNLSFSHPLSSVPRGEGTKGSCRRRGAGAGRGGLAAAVTAEGAGGGELAELVPDHVLLHEHLQELVAVVDLERVAHELRRDRARPGPGPDRLLGPTLVQRRDLPEQLFVDVGAFFGAS